MSNSTPTVLIAGGSGLLGRRLTRMLLENGCKVRWLVRRYQSVPQVEVFEWNPAAGFMSPDALQGIDVLVNLSGAGIADKRWTDARKKEILESRTQSNEILQAFLKSSGLRIPRIICASAIGYYSGSRAPEPCTEEAAAGVGFLAECCVAWEKSNQLFSNSCEELFMVRIGIVLSNHGGALPVMTAPFRWGLGSPLGTGKQSIPWIHEDDLSGIFYHLISGKARAGVYNAVAPESCTNKVFSRTMADVMHKPYFLPPVPALLIHLLKGEMATMVTQGKAVSAEKISRAGYVFAYPEVRGALTHLLASNR